MSPFATPVDLAAWLGADAPDNAFGLLRSASFIVAHAARFARYDVDSSGKPSDPDLVDALRDATCAQVAGWIAAGIDPSTGGLTATQTVRRRTLDTASIEYDTGGTATAQAFEARRKATVELNDEARLILGSVGLLTTGIVVYG